MTPNDIANNISVAILMGTFNGEKYIREQINSIIKQEFTNWTLYISDDGSRDSTIDIIESYKNLLPGNKIQLLNGPSKGFSINFMNLASDSRIKADYYFFSDQDDLWLPNKISNALCSQIFKDVSMPSLYCGSTLLGDESGKVYGKSIAPSFPCSFRNALVQCVAGGNTMAFNQAFKDIMEKVGLTNVVSHDWWLYQLVTGIGGNFYYDPIPTIIYRQHPEALVGANTSIAKKIDRIRMVLNGRFMRWNLINTEALDKAKTLLTNEHLQILDLFIKLRSAKSIKDRFRLLNVSGIYRQGKMSTFALFLAVLLRKI